MVLTGLSTEEVLQKISEAGIEVTDVEAQRFRGKFYLNAILVDKIFVVANANG